MCTCNGNVLFMIRKVGKKTWLLISIWNAIKNTILKSFYVVHCLITYKNIVESKTMLD